MTTAAPHAETSLWASAPGWGSGDRVLAASPQVFVDLSGSRAGRVRWLLLLVFSIAAVFIACLPVAGLVGTHPSSCYADSAVGSAPTSAGCRA